MVDVPSQITEKLLERQKTRFPNFKESMWYMAYVKENGYTNSIFYDWTSAECFYLVYNDKALADKTEAVKRFVETGGASSSDAAKKEKIATKYCEKVYNFYSGKRD